MFNYAGYDPANDILYGYVEATNGMFFCTASGANPRVFTSVTRMPDDAIHVACMTYNQVSGKLIGFASSKFDGKIIEISTTDGSQTEIGTLTDISDYITGLCYSPWDEAYWYAVCSNSTCAIQLLDPDDFSVISSSPYASLMEFCGMACPDRRKIPASAPGESTLVNSIFADGALEGSLTYRLPSVTFGGTPILGNVDWVLYVDEAEMKRGSAAAGSEVAVTVADLEEGNHTFRFVCSLAGNEGKYNETAFYVGNDTPKAPASVTLTADKITWTPVTEGIHEGYVNPGEVTYNVYLNGKKIATGLKVTGCSSQITTGAEFTSYTASVEAVFDGKISEKANSDDLRYGEALELPLSYEPTEKDSRLFTISDGNGDANTFTYTYYDYGNYKNVPLFIYKYSSTENADDWVFLPLAKFDDANAVYKFSMNAFRTDQYTETVEVALCSAPDGNSVVKKILEPFNLDNPRTSNQAESAEIAFSQYFTGEFTVPTPGNYYVGVHCISPADQFSTYLRDFSLGKIDGVVKSAPGSVKSLNAVRGVDGALNAAVTFIFPTATFEGVTYEADKTLMATVQAAGCEAVTASGKPGESVTITAPTKQGANTVTVTVLDGTLRGVPANVEVYTGVERPGTVEDLAITVDATDYTAHLTWKAPSEGADGGYVAPEGIRYYFCEQQTNSLGETEWVVTEEIGTDVFEYDHTLPEGSRQAYYNFGIIAQNFVGIANNLIYTGAVMGKPYDTPVNVTCTQTQALGPMLTYGSGSGWNLMSGNPGVFYPDYATEDKLMGLYIRSRSATGEKIKFSLPKFSLKGFSNPAIRLYTYGGSTSEFSVGVSASGIDEKIVKTVKAGDFTTTGPQYVTIDLGPEFADKDWVMFYIHANASTSETFILYNYKVFDDIPYDFGVYAIEGPVQAKIGEEAKYVAHVLNYGSEANPMPASKWRLTDEDGNLVAEVNVPAGTENVEPDADLDFDIAFTPTAEHIGKLTLTYAVDGGDGKDTNDSMSKDLDVTTGRTPAVTDLSAKEISYDKVTLTWTPPVAEGQMAESFEEETPFVLDDASDMIAGFKRVDGDGLKVYGSSNPSFYDIPGALGPSSFLCWNKNDISDLTYMFAPKTGDQFLVAFCPSEAAEDSSEDIDPADDWLISPEVEAGSDLSFSVRPVTYEYGPETIEVMYSTSGDTPEDFKVLKTIKVGENMDPEATTVYEDFTFTLPAGARYFAIHYVSQDVFGIMIDDIMYMPAGNDFKITGYDIYRDGGVIAADVPCEDGTYDDATVEENSDYTYRVVPVLSDGTKGLDSNSLTIRTTGVEGVTAGSRAVYAVTGAILVNGYEGEKVVISSADGKVVARSSAANASERYSLTGGVYVVKAGKDLYKLIVK